MFVDLMQKIDVILMIGVIDIAENTRISIRLKEKFGMLHILIDISNDAHKRYHINNRCNVYK